MQVTSLLQSFTLMITEMQVSVKVSCATRGVG